MSKRVAVITGGEGDLALAIAGALPLELYEVQAPAHGTLDVTKQESVRNYFAPLDRVDLLINNAAVREDSLVGRMTEESWERVLSTNLRGAFLCSQAVSRKMLAQRNGHIVNIGSFAGKIGTAGQANYAAAKAGLIGLTQTLAREFGKRGVRVNCVLPGFLETKFSASISPEAKSHALEMHELRNFNTPAEAARFIAFLDTMPFVSGQVFQLDSRISAWT